ncbi:cysteine synthase A [Pseudoclavibacter sp. JAI123]|uniref:PLP-dependent cysteine synthase family protein n=1 Tax=Pseudoclavibacter sp. JAI123 TaxID=2723065 RepID=UPI0015CDF4C2|nr:cysteine synthase family protein [Pseudoclavibacter sp. JAI123]NYF13166.1 cysteine synthase A [Pseudoclavibacter sp. JAI123]
MAHITQNFVDLIGHTPLFELHRYRDARQLPGRIVAKLEQFNPAGSVKDRIAWGIIRDAEERGALKPGDLIVDITSGNTGVALAAIAASRGYRTKFYLSDNIAKEKLRLIHALGSEIVLIPNLFFVDPEALEKVTTRIQEENPDAYFTNQLGNPANPRTHLTTTGPEIWADTDGEIDVLVGGVGTGGTLNGSGTFLKSLKPELRIVVAEPGLASIPSEEVPYPAEIDGVHKVTDVEAEQLPDNYNGAIVDEVVALETQDAFQTSRELAREEGLVIGTSAGAILYAATRIAEREENRDKLIVAVFPDAGERYFSGENFAQPVTTAYKVEFAPVLA